ncbi:MAG: BolA/IbaG family iron-sulfur metabolism protein, partial [Plesiomonas shigelloides]
MIQEQIIAKLQAAFAPLHLDVINESHRHNVPAGSESHFKVVLVSDAFCGQRLLARHRAVNAALAEE